MEFLHISDLHLGKPLGGWSLYDDQKHILSQIVDIAREKAPDAVLIAGDVFDRSAPAAEAVALFDSFLGDLADLGKPVLIIAGNHDSAERIAYGGRIMRRGGVHLSPVYDGTLTPVTLEDAHGPVQVWLLPFLDYAAVRQKFPDETIADTTDAVRTALAHAPIDPSVRKVLIAHQYVTGAESAGSEELYRGGQESIPAALFDVFDYTALGHLHRPQDVGGRPIRYCGTPLAYSLSEAGQEKSVTFVTLGEKGTPAQIETVPLVPLRPVIRRTGTFEDMMALPPLEAYVHFDLTDEKDVLDAAGRLAKRHPYFMGMAYVGRKTARTVTADTDEIMEEAAPLDLFSAFFQSIHGDALTEEQKQLLEGLIDDIWNKEEDDA